jgi:hypothetical protein
MIELIQTYDRAEMERREYLLRTGQSKKPSWGLRESHILRSELKRTGILRFQRDGYEYICNLCNFNTGKSGILRHMKSFHSEILKERITYLVSTGLLDQSFLRMNSTMRRRTKEGKDRIMALRHENGYLDF